MKTTCEWGVSLPREGGELRGSSAHGPRQPTTNPRQGLLHPEEPMFNPFTPGKPEGGSRYGYSELDRRQTACVGVRVILPEYPSSKPKAACHIKDGVVLGRDWEGRMCVLKEEGRKGKKEDEKMRRWEDGKMGR